MKIQMRKYSENVRLRAATLVAATLFVWSCDSGSSAGLQDSEAYLNELASWKTERVASLKGPTGFLNLAGLFWLRQDVSTFGSSPDSDFVLPAHASPMLGSFRKESGKIVMEVSDGAEVFHAGTPVKSIVMDDDSSEQPVMLIHGSLAWTVIRRDDKFYVRLRDFDNPAIADFKPIEYYPVDVAYRVPAVIERFDEPRQLRVDTVITGLDYRPQSPGKLKFELAGESFELEAYESGERLFLIFGDATSGRETYPAGRFLYASMPDDSGVTILDFNKAYNPPCAFNDFATCPVAAPQNRLKTKVLAGERFDQAMHWSPTTH